MSFALGGAATRAIAPGAEMRLDLAHTRPGATAYFTVSAGIFANR